MSRKVPPGLKKWDVKKGEETQRYLHKRTINEPFFAAATGALHSGPISYGRQQPFVEKVTDMGPDAVDEVHEAKDAIRGAQFWKQKSKTLSDVSKCFKKVCEDNDCTEDRTREDFIDCVDEDVTGIGRKTKDLMRLYLGDEEAVAVDRHVADWACKNTNVCHDIKKGSRISKDEYRELKEIVRNEAGKHDMSPAKLQVSAWVSGACKAKGSEPLFIGDDMVVECGGRGNRKIGEF